MTKREHFATALVVLGSALGRDLPAPALEGYWIALQVLTEEELATATKRALAECKFMPAPSELLALAGRGRNLTADVAQAWEAVRTAIDRHDYTASVDFGPLVNAVVRNLGGWDRLCRLDLEALNVWARKEFERIYEAFAGKEASALNGAPHMGAFKSAPIQIAIGGKLPLKQIEAATPMRSVLRVLAEEKSAG